MSIELKTCEEQIPLRNVKSVIQTKEILNWQIISNSK